MITLSLAEFEKALTEAGVPFTLTKPEFTEGQHHLFTREGAEFVFVEDAPFSGPPGLAAWSVHLVDPADEAAGLQR